VVEKPCFFESCGIPGVLGGEGKSGAILFLGLAGLGLVFGPGNQAPMLIAD